ncbi:MAG: cytochrome aa3 oxidase assembly protein CtaA [Phycisphaerae bacterium]
MSTAGTLEYATMTPSGPGRPWAHRLAVVLAGLTFILIVAGANVTSKNVGLAVPDWPLSFQSVNPPGWLTNMDGTRPGVRDEHGHRLIGALTGLIVIALVVALFVQERRVWVRRLGVIALLAVIAQGVMGGLRVWERSLGWAIVHGCFGQAFFCLTLALAAVTSPRWRREFAGAGERGSKQAASPTTADRPDQYRALRTWTAVTAAFVYAQLILGALTRHTGTNGWAVLHVGGALGVGACLILAAQHAFARPEWERHLAAPMIALFALFGLQLLLGVATYVLVLSMLGPDPTTAMQAYVPTIHVAVGALILGASFIVALRAFAIGGTGSGGARTPSGGGEASA